MCASVHKYLHMPTPASASGNNMCIHVYMHPCTRRSEAEGKANRKGKQA